MAVSSRHTGWRLDPANDRLDIYYEGTRVGHIDATALAVALNQTITGTLGVTGATTLDDLTTTGTVIMSNIPTSDPSVAGQLWANSGVLTVSAGS
jgi:hypothetical protein